MRGCDHQSIPLLFLKLRGRDECEGWTEKREREGRVQPGYSLWKCGRGGGRGGRNVHRHRKRKKEIDWWRERYRY